MHVVHKTAGQLYDRNLQYEVFAFRRDQNGSAVIIGTAC